jgi:hypothetical protein
MVRFLGLRGLSFGPKESLREITSTVGDVAPPIGSNGAKGGRMHGRIRGGGSSSNTSVTMDNILGNVSLHTVPPISGIEIMVHLIPSGMNGISRLMCFTKYLIL